MTSLPLPESMDELWAALGDGDGEAPAPALRSRVLGASVLRRPGGRPSVDVPAVTPVEAFARQVDSFDALLGSLSAGDWNRAAIRDLDVQGLVGHLIGVEADFQGSLDAAGIDGGQPRPGWRGDADHVASTQPFAIAQAARAHGATHADWRRAAGVSVHRLRALDAPSLTAPLTLHGLALALGPLLAVRTFELWTHEEDIRRATGRALAAPPDSTLRLMTGLATELLAAGVSRGGGDGPGGIARIVLTGAGGGAWTVAVPPAAATPARVRIVADAVDFCRLAADRLRPADLVASIDGDRDLAARVLRGASALALD